MEKQAKRDRDGERALTALKMAISESGLRGTVRVIEETGWDVAGERIDRVGIEVDVEGETNYCNSERGNESSLTGAVKAIFIEMGNRVPALPEDASLPIDFSMIDIRGDGIESTKFWEFWGSNEEGWAEAVMGMALLNLALWEEGVKGTDVQASLESENFDVRVLTNHRGLPVRIDPSQFTESKTLADFESADREFTHQQKDSTDDESGDEDTGLPFPKNI